MKRHRKIRKKIFGTKDRPRLSIFRSNKSLYAQIIDDRSGKTILGMDARAIQRKSRKSVKNKKISKSEEAFLLGKVFAQHAKQKGIKRVLFDRGGLRYHGRIHALARGAREEGLRF